MDLADPQQWTAYSYANNSPITFSDPTGFIPEEIAGGYDDFRRANSDKCWSGCKKKKFTAKDTYQAASRSRTRRCPTVRHSGVRMAATTSTIWPFQRAAPNLIFSPPPSTGSNQPCFRIGRTVATFWRATPATWTPLI